MCVYVNENSSIRFMHAEFILHKHICMYLRRPFMC